MDLRPVVALLLGVALPITACAGKPTRSASQPPGTTGSQTAPGAPGTGPVRTSRTAGPILPNSPGTEAAPPAQSTQAASCVDRVMAGMTPAQRVGQLFMTAVSTSGISQAESAALRGHDVGSVILMGRSTAGVQHIRGITNQVQSAAPSIGGTKVQLFTAADQEGGKVQILNGPGFSAMPSAVVQGQWPPSQLRRRAAAWGGELRAAGVTMDLAPVADTVPAGIGMQNQPIGRLMREYGDNPTTVARQSGAFLRGMQQSGVTTTVKHFPGLGQVRGNTDFSTNVTDNRTTRNSPYLAPFRSGIQAGTRFTMVSLATYTLIDPSHQAAFSSVVMRDMLRNSLGFKGVIISDDLGNAAAVRAVPADQRALKFLGAGGNMVLTVDPATIAPMTGAVLGRLHSDAALRSEVDGSVHRILAAKREAGLLRCG